MKHLPVPMQTKQGRLVHMTRIPDDRMAAMIAKMQAAISTLDDARVACPPVEASRTQARSALTRANRNIEKLHAAMASVDTLLKSAIVEAGSP
jgi:hypothetical protein